MKTADRRRHALYALDESVAALRLAQMHAGALDPAWCEELHLAALKCAQISAAIRAQIDIEREASA